MEGGMEEEIKRELARGVASICTFKAVAERAQTTIKGNQ
jgi:hypothetical protein